ncbi:MAG: response regulator [Erythrobacter sp.]|nr:response regulator [Erythrobacter sp.]
MAKILIADDDPILVELVRFRLEGAGYQVLEATDGQQAIEAVKTERPDLIVLDSMMPLLSGREVLLYLQKNTATKDIPVIMLTARSGESDIVSAIRSGASDYLTKPFIPQELLVRIEKLLTLVT